MKPNGKFYITVGYDGVPELRGGLQAHHLYLEEDVPLQTIRRMLRVLRAVPSARIILLDSTSGPMHPDLLAAAIISLLPRRFRPLMVMMGAMWHQNKGLRSRIEKLILGLADRGMQGYIVQSHEELTVFPELWDIDPDKVQYCPYFYTMVDSELAEETDESEPYIFAGGNSHRDYEPLLEAARRMPDHKFIIASRLQFPDVPPNVVMEPVPHERFVKLMENARAVVTPLLPGLTRAAGQQTYLNAMRLSKISIVNTNDIFGVYEYIEDGKNGLLVDGTAEGYVKACKWVFDPANQSAIEAMQVAAHDSVRDTFTYENHVACIAGILDEVLDKHSPQQ